MIIEKISSDEEEQSTNQISASTKIFMPDVNSVLYLNDSLILNDDPWLCERCIESLTQVGYRVLHPSFDWKTISIFKIPKLSKILKEQLSISSLSQLNMSSDENLKRELVFIKARMRSQDFVQSMYSLVMHHFSSSDFSKTDDQFPVFGSTGAISFVSFEYLSKDQMRNLMFGVDICLAESIPTELAVEDPRNARSSEFKIPSFSTVYFVQKSARNITIIVNTKEIHNSITLSLQLSLSPLFSRFPMLLLHLH